jgi:hypothetical protein
MAADVLVHPHERRPASRRRRAERQEDERRHIQIAGAAAIGDLLHTHEAVARRAPLAVGGSLLIQLFLEVRRLTVRNG